MLIDRETFQATETDADGDINGTVEVTLRGKTQRVRAKMVPKYGWLFAYGIVGRYHTSTKNWPGSIQQETDGKEYVQFGRYDNNPKFRKENNIWFA